MAKKVYEESNIASIASVIREKTGKSTTYKTSEMPSGVAEVYEAGKQAEYDKFWDVFQQNGKRGEYRHAFRWWNERIFYPKYDFIVTGNCDSMFSNFGDTINAGEPFDLAERLKECGVRFRWENGAGALPYLFNYSKISRVPVLDLSSCTNISRMFNGCDVLVTIDKIIAPTTTTVSWEGVFHFCTSLENIVIDGQIVANGFNVQWSTKLTHDSLLSIINALADKSADTSGTEWFITIGSENVAKLSSEELNIAYNKGWDVY